MPMLQMVFEFEVSTPLSFAEPDGICQCSHDLNSHFTSGFCLHCEKECPGVAKLKVLMMRTAFVPGRVLQRIIKP